MTETENRVIHLFVRFKSGDFLGKKDVVTIQEHRELLKAKGEVWWGIKGIKLSDNTVMQMQGQISREITTRVYMYEQETQKWYLAILANITNRKLPLGEKDKIPAYYRDKVECATYLNLSKITDIPHRRKARGIQNPLLIVYEDGGEDPDHIKVLSSGISLVLKPGEIEPSESVDAGQSHVETLLHSKKQVILYGPPGTGKTYNAKEFATKFLTDEE